jgi:hypothetical protein
MSELDRLIEIARSLPQAKVHALLGVAEQMTDYVRMKSFCEESTPLRHSKLITWLNDQ